MKIQKLAKIVLFSGLLVVVVATVGFVSMTPATGVSHAASTAIDKPSVPIGSSPDALTGSKIKEIITSIANWLVGIALVIALIMIVWGGIMWMWARGDDTKAQEARKIILNGILGAAVILALGLIFSTIQKIVSSPTTFLP